MKQLFTVAIALTFALAFTSCTDNQMARNYGGTETIKLEPNEEFINMTWKQDNMWIMTRDTTTGLIYAREKSSFGALEGKVIFKKQ